MASSPALYGEVGAPASSSSFTIDTIDTNDTNDINDTSDSRADSSLDLVGLAGPLDFESLLTSSSSLQTASSSSPTASSSPSSDFSSSGSAVGQQQHSSEASQGRAEAGEYGEYGDGKAVYDHDKGVDTDRTNLANRTKRCDNNNVNCRDQSVVAECTYCGAGFCYNCVLIHKCPDHSHMDCPSSSVEQHTVEELRRLALACSEGSLHVQSLIDTECARLEKHNCQVRSHVSEAFASIINQMEERKMQILDQIDQDERVRKHRLDNVKQKWVINRNTFNERFGGLDQVFSKVEKGNMRLVNAANSSQKMQLLLSEARNTVHLVSSLVADKVCLSPEVDHLRSQIQSLKFLSSSSSTDSVPVSLPAPLGSLLSKQPPIARPPSTHYKGQDATTSEDNVLGLCYLSLEDSSDTGTTINNNRAEASLAQSIASFAGRSSKDQGEHRRYQTPAAATGYVPSSSQANMGRGPSGPPQYPYAASQGGGGIMSQRSISDCSGRRMLGNSYEPWSTANSKELSSCEMPEGIYQGRGIGEYLPPSMHVERPPVSTTPMSMDSQLHLQQQQYLADPANGKYPPLSMLAHQQNGSFPPKSQIKRQKMIYRCKFGEFGVLEGQFTEPSGVAVNAQNDIIVADTNNHRIQIFDKEGRFKFQFGTVGKRNGELLYPNRVAVIRQSGDIVVTERSPTHQVQIYNQYGQFVRKFGASILQHPRGVCVDPKGLIVVVECKVMRVIIFDQMGNVLNKFGCSKHLEFPNGVVVNDRREIFISDNRAHCVKVFNYEGAYLRQIGGEGITNYPIGVGINGSGEVTIADNHNNFNLSVFSQEGTLLSALESKVKHAQCFDVALMDDGSVVLASKDYRLYIYRYVQILPTSL